MLISATEHNYCFVNYFHIIHFFVKSSIEVSPKYSVDVRILDYVFSTELSQVHLLMLKGQHSLLRRNGASTLVLLFKNFKFSFLFGGEAFLRKGRNNILLHENLTGRSTKMAEMVRTQKIGRGLLSTLQVSKTISSVFLT